VLASCYIFMLYTLFQKFHSSPCSRIDQYSPSHTLSTFDSIIHFGMLVTRNLWTGSSCTLYHALPFKWRNTCCEKSDILRVLAHNASNAFLNACSLFALCDAAHAVAEICWSILHVYVHSQKSTHKIDMPSSFRKIVFCMYAQKLPCKFCLGIPWRSWTAVNRKMLFLRRNRAHLCLFMQIYVLSFGTFVPTILCLLHLRRQASSCVFPWSSVLHSRFDSDFASWNPTARA